MTRPQIIATMAAQLYAANGNTKYAITEAAALLTAAEEEETAKNPSHLQINCHGINYSVRFAAKRWTRAEIRAAGGPCADRDPYDVVDIGDITLFLAPEQTARLRDMLVAHLAANPPEVATDAA